jgi:hypothetical protein
LRPGPPPGAPAAPGAQRSTSLTGEAPAPARSPQARRRGQECNSMIAQGFSYPATQKPAR